MLALRLPPEIEERLSALARATHWPAQELLGIIA